MADFSTEASLVVQLDQRSVEQAKSTIQKELGGPSVAVEADTSRAGSLMGGGSSAALAGGVSGGLTDGFASDATSLLEETVELAAERTEYLHELVDLAEQGALGGGGGGGLMDSVLSFGIISTLTSGGLTSLLGTTSLGALVTSVSLKSLITRVPAFATLVTAASLSDDLVRGHLGPDDLVDSAISLGEIMTFGQIDNDVITGALGTATLTVGSVQLASGLASMLPTIGIGSLLAGKLGGSALGGYFGTTSLSGLLSGVGGGSALGGLLGTVSIGAILTGLGSGALAGLLGTVAITELVTGGRINWFKEPSPEFTGKNTPLDPNTGTATGSLRTPQQLNDTFTPTKTTPTPVSEMSTGEILEKHSPAELQEMSVPNGTTTSNTTTQSAREEPRSTSSASKQSRQRRSNSAAEARQKRAEVNYSPTWNVDFSKLERKMERDIGRLEDRVSSIEKTLDDIRR